MPFNIIRQDITKMKVDAIVNAANTELKQGGGVCGAIFNAAGAQRMQSACDRLSPIQVGQAVITPGFDLEAKHVIHTVGPIWQGGAHGEEELLRSAYHNSLTLAHEHGLESIAFPLISSGIYGYPNDRALGVALSAIGSFVLEHDMQVYLTVFNRASFQLSKALNQAVTSYVNDHYVDEREARDQRRRLQARSLELELQVQAQAPPLEWAPPAPKAADLSMPPVETEETFTEVLLRIIREKDLLDPYVYRRANISRKLFSKIRNKKHYQPSRDTVLSLALALELDKEETEDLLARAGFALSPSSEFDLIIAYFIETRNYDIFEVNATLLDRVGKTLS